MLTPEMIDAMRESRGHRRVFHASAITLAEAGLFTAADVADWAALFDGFDLMLIAALARVAESPEETEGSAATEALLAVCEALVSHFEKAAWNTEYEAQNVLLEMINEYVPKLEAALAEVKEANP